uniref:DEX1 C-terminal domain-containing protein n=3 Tax=Hemiselmis andersenii TaxID=464988 RepID=A0A7S1EIS3_HEMAN|mmetsp:Transcript_48443/g.117651  ORF Transcript_48443/g.117651 Transcript_48443/m.117651 type:complete len:191 (+) Transcript_48443:119-691(+)
MVLADDVTGNGFMDLLVSTMNGNVIALGTDVQYHPMKAWTSREQGNNNVELRDGRQGIFVTEGYRHHGDKVGATMMLEFEIVDKRPVKGFGAGSGTYSVKVSIGGNAVLLQKTYTRPGKYLEELPCPARRQYSTIYVQMVNELGQHFEDRVAMSFNMRFYRAMKWVLVLPFVAMAGVIVFIKDMQHMLPV